MQISSIKRAVVVSGWHDLEAQLVDIYTASRLFVKSLTIFRSVDGFNSGGDDFSSRSLCPGLSYAGKSDSTQWKQHHGVPQRG